MFFLINALNYDKYSKKKNKGQNKQTAIPLKNDQITKDQLIISEMVIFTNYAAVKERKIQNQRKKTRIKKKHEK